MSVNELLERSETKVSRSVLRGGWQSDLPSLPDYLTRFAGTGKRREGRKTNVFFQSLPGLRLNIAHFLCVNSPILRGIDSPCVFPFAVRRLTFARRAPNLIIKGLFAWPPFSKVGAAVLSHNQKIYVGCNVEHRFRSHDVHAEVNAITNMIAHGEIELVAILIAAEKERFTPCGSCMDWIMQFGGQDCLVAYQQNRTGKITVYKAKELMPYYPM